MRPCWFTGRDRRYRKWKSNVNIIARECDLFVTFFQFFGPLKMRKWVDIVRVIGIVPVIQAFIQVNDHYMFCSDIIFIVG